MIYFTADLHINHRNIIKYLNRPFMSEAEKQALASASTRDEVKAVRISDDTIAIHDNALIDNINATVQSGDLLYVLGDFCMGRLEEVRAYRNRINCNNIFLIRGNHDKLRDNEYKQVFNNVKDLDSITWNGQKIVVCHYPMISWRNSCHGAWQLYGHCHGNLMHFLVEHGLDEKLLSMDVGVDCNNYSPVSVETVQKVMEHKSFCAIG